MKFGENLKSNLTHEWKKQYIDYEKLKGTFGRVPVRNVSLFDVIDKEMQNDRNWAGNRFLVSS